MNWKKICKGCGRCCGPVPFDIKLYDQNKHNIQELPISEDRDSYPGLVIPFTESLNCVFLKPNKQCAVYDLRPGVCKLQGTIPQLLCPKI